MPGLVNILIVQAKKTLCFVIYYRLRERNLSCVYTQLLGSRRIGWKEPGRKTVGRSGTMRAGEEM